MTQESSNRLRRLSGLSGLAGALLFFTAVMLFYGYFGPGWNLPEGMLERSLFSGIA